MPGEGPLRRLLSEPLLHFAVLGALVFGISSAFGSEEDGATTIVVDQTVVERITADLSKSLGRAPTPAEREAAIDRWVDEELLYREGLRLGLDRNDPLVRQRVVQKAEYVSTNLELPADPTDEQLQQFMRDNASRYAGPPRRDFTLVTLRRASADEDDTRARAVLEQLKAGADPTALGGRVATGRKFSPSNTAGTYGPAIADAVSGLSEGQWTTVAFDGGWTFVRLDALHPGETPPFEKIRNRLTLDYKGSRLGVELRERLDELRDEYRVVRPE